MNHHHQQMNNNNTTIDAVGIALVVEEAGQGAKLLFRYPEFQPSERFGRNVRPSQDMFFALSNRVMEKLFRPQPPLCEQPITLHVGNTVFCCRAVSVHNRHHPGEDGGENDQPTEDDDDSDEEANEPGVDGFYHNTATMTTGAREEKNTHDPHHRHLRRGSTSASCRNHNNRRRINLYSIIIAIASDSEDSVSNAVSYPLYEEIMNKTHFTLHKLSKVLDREEKRCRYVSVQATSFLHIIEEETIKLQQQEQKPPSEKLSSMIITPSSLVHDPNPSSTDHPNGSNPAQLPHHRHMRTQSRSNSIINVAANMVLSSSSVPDETHHTSKNHHNPQRKIFELLVEKTTAKSRHGNGNGNGNLAAELSHVLHALSWKQQERPISRPIEIDDHTQANSHQQQSHTQKIVFINAHVALPIDPILTSPESTNYPLQQFPQNVLSKVVSTGKGPPPPPQTLNFVRPSSGGTGAGASGCTGNGSSNTHYASTTTAVVVRPYHTLLFPHPHKQPSDLIRAPRAAPGSSQNLHKLISTMDPRKSLADVSVAAMVPLASTLHIASSLVENGTCVLAHVVTRSSSFVCQDDCSNKISMLQTQFAQRFGTSVPLAFIVSAFTATTDTIYSSSLSPLKNPLVGHILLYLSQNDNDNRDVFVGTTVAQPPPPPPSYGEKKGKHSNRNTTKSASTKSKSINKKGKATECMKKSSSLQPLKICVNQIKKSRVNHPERRRDDDMKKTDVAFGIVDNENNDTTEAIAISLVTWLRSHNIIMELKEYLVVSSLFKSYFAYGRGRVGQTNTFCDVDASSSSVGSLSMSPSYHLPMVHNTRTTLSSSLDPYESSSRNNHDKDPSASSPYFGEERLVGEDEIIFNALMDAGCLLGRISTTAIAWKFFPSEPKKLLRFVERATKLRWIEVRTRISQPGDDWGAI